MIKYQLYLLLFFCFVNEGIAQTISYHQNYTIKDGLPTNELYWLTQSNDGRLWIGSDAGLVEYDGLHFKTYSNKAVKNSSVNGMVIDQKNRMWGHNFANQLFCFQNDSLYLIETWENTVTVGSLNKITPIDSNRIYLSLTNSQSYVYHIHEDSLVKDTLIKYSFIFNPIWINKKKRHLLKATHHQLTSLHLLTDTTTKKISCNACYIPSEAKQQIKYVLEQSPIGSIFYVRNYINITVDTTFNYFFKYTIDSIYPIPFPPSIKSYQAFNLQIINTHWQGDSILWLATSQGIFAWNLHHNSSKHYLKGTFISDVYKDMEGNIWGTGIQKGLFFIPSEDIQEHLIHLGGKNSLQAIEKDHLGNLLLGHSKNEITYLDGKTATALCHIKLPHSNIIHRIHFDPIEQVYWIIIDDIPLLFDPKTYQLSLSNLPSLSIKKMIFDAYQNIYCATGQGAYLISKKNPEEQLPNSPLFSNLSLDTIDFSKKRSLTEYELCYSINPKKNNALILSTKNVRSYSIALQKVPIPTVWIGTANGLKRIVKGKIESVLDLDGASIIANDLLVVNDSMLWVASNNKGIFLLQHGQIKTHLTLKEGMPTKKVYKLAWQAPYLWIGSEKGLVRYNPAQQELLQWSAIQGLSINKVKNLVLSNKRVYLSDGQKLLSTSINLPPIKPFVPLIQITHFEVNNQEKKRHHPIELAATENSIKISFQGVSLKSQGSFTYLYRLLGSEKEWIKTNAYNNTIRYPQLAPGSYQFEVTVVDALGYPSREAAQISFTILPPFYKTWWFFLLVLSVGSLLIGGIFKWQIRQVEIKNNKRERQNQLDLEHSQLERDLRIAQLKALKAQMNPHFVFNILNSIQGLYIINDKKKANLLLSQFSQLIRSTLDRSEALEILLEEEIKLLQLYLEVEHIRVNQNFIFSITVDPLLQEKEIYIPSLLLQPYIENALKHGLLHKKGEKAVHVQFQLSHPPAFLTITIDDNGIGRTASKMQRRQQHQSFSVSANRKRLQLLNAEKKQPIILKFIDKTDAQGLAQGTTVILQIPLE
ncbi:MAG: histidine kinase [Aureispira sp.]